MINFLNSNSVAIVGIGTIALLLVTVFYAWTTYRLFHEAKTTRIMAGKPRIVAYLRTNEVHSNIVQLCIANLSSVAAIEVSASIEKVTDWPDSFDLENSRILRDLSYMRPHEVLKFDLAVGPDLFRGDEIAIFRSKISYSDLNGQAFKFDETLKAESVAGFSSWQIYSIDDVARRLKEISDTLKSYRGFKRLQIDTYTSQDRDREREVNDKRRREKMAKDSGE